MSQVVRSRPLTRVEYWRHKLDRLYFRCHAQVSVALAFLIACAIGLAIATLLLGGIDAS